MKQIIIPICIIIFITSCHTKNPSRNEGNEKEYDLRAEVADGLKTIDEISQKFIDNPVKDEDFNRNDSLSQQIGKVIEDVINKLIQSYGRTHTDSIFMVLNSLDDSGFIPDDLLHKLTEKDFSSKIGKVAKENYLKYQLSVSSNEKTLENIDLCLDNLMVYSVHEKDTLLLCDLLKEHKGYKVLDFWSAWCAPCRVFNRTFKHHYAEFSKKGIELYGLGAQIDNVETHFVAVTRDNTPWRQFVDINDNIYKKFNTRVMPFQILLDENNRIIKILSYDMEKELNEIPIETTANKK